METPTSKPIKSEFFTVGRNLGNSPWVTVDQEMISKFGEATLDLDPMHVDPSWSKENSPYGETIAFGFLTSSLLTHMLHGVLGTSTAGDATDEGYFMNYGMDYLRFISPVPVNCRIRGYFKILDNRIDDRGRNIIKYDCEIKIEGVDKPALVAQWLAILIPHEKSSQK
ncbi:MAG: Nodulation protein N [Alphaproteobacteria bacterium]|nr:MAG: Nodulation protein N [Alphaproteobacteria bacterium]